MIQPQDTVLDVEHVAAILGVAPWTVREEIRKGRLQSFRVGRLIRVSREALERYVAPQRAAL
jgi:excisionase family DNA binding protein